jgi:hypothetical protein
MKNTRYTLKITGRSWSGRVNRTSYRTEAEALAALVEYVRRNWADEIGGDYPGDDEAVRVYFDETDESYEVRR